MTTWLNLDLNGTIIECHFSSSDICYIKKIGVVVRCYGHKQNETTRFPNHMNKSVFSSKSR
jgi:hypothetical protein